MNHHHVICDIIVDCDEEAARGRVMIKALSLSLPIWYVKLTGLSRGDHMHREPGKLEEYSPGFSKHSSSERIAVFLLTDKSFKVLFLTLTFVISQEFRFDRL